ncbi:hypothetical protein MMC13_005776 [Lambiella insularis]|nr:hypothetical protein [Lambiella insularis]
MKSEAEVDNRSLFRDCFSSSILQRLSVDALRAAKKRSGKKRKNIIKSASEKTSNDRGDIDGSDASELADFIHYLASEVFEVVPLDLQELSFVAIRNDPRLAAKYAESSVPSTVEAIVSRLPPSVTDSIQAYGLLDRSTDISHLISSVIPDYIGAVTAPPPIWSTTRSSACEICERDWIPLTYHHLIPKQTHEKAIKRQWHDEWRLNSVAWLCRACHCFVHRIASNEELAKDLWTVDLLMARQDVQSWAKWADAIQSSISFSDVDVVWLMSIFELVAVSLLDAKQIAELRKKGLQKEGLDLCSFPPAYRQWL